MTTLTTLIVLSVTFHATGVPGDCCEEPIVIETSRLLANPREVLGNLCDRIGVSFDDAMLSWPAGPKPEDGAWAPYWYDGVWKSTGWQPAKPKNAVLLPEVAKALPEAEAAYERLLPYGI